MEQVHTNSVTEQEEGNTLEKEAYALLEKELESYKEKLKTEKKKRREAERKLTNREKTILEKQKTQNDLQEKYVLLKKQLKEEKEKGKKLSFSLQEKQNEVDGKEKRIQTLYKEVGEKDEKIRSIKAVFKQNNKLRRQLRNAKLKLTNYKKEISNLNKKIKFEDNFENLYKEKFEKEKIKNSNLSKEIRALKNKIEKFEKEPVFYHHANQKRNEKNIPAMVQFLVENVNIHNVDQYLLHNRIPFGPLSVTVSRIRKEKREREEKKNPKRHGELAIGYIHKNEKDEILFVDIAKNEYPVDENRTFPIVTVPLTEHLPVQAIVTKDGVAIIKKVYEEEQEITTTVQRKPSRKAKVKKEEEIVHLGDYKVLLISSPEEKDKYTRHLEKRGLTVIWHDPYSENDKRAGEKFKRADVVIVCTSHTSHSVLNQIDKYHTKVEEIENDSAEAIETRIRYILLHKLKIS